MGPIQFGAVNSVGTPTDILDPMFLADKLEEWGYDSFWVPDLLTRPDIDPIVLLSAVAARTEKIKLGTGVLILPIRAPVQLAKTALSLDAFSNGRLILGAGLGEYTEEVKSAQILSGSRSSLADESLAVLRKLLHDSGATHQGQYFSFKNLTVLPRSSRLKGIPVWTSAAWKGKIIEGPLNRAARFADGFIYDAPAQIYGEAKDRISEKAASLGRNPDDIEWACWMFTCLGPSKEEAWDSLKGVMSSVLDRPLGDGSGGCYAFGTADDCIETIQEYIDIGVTNFCISAKCPPEQMLNLYESIASDVIPRLR